MSHYLTCRIAQEWYGIPIEHVIEVLHIVALNDVPNEDVIGMMTLREQIIAVIDLSQVFNVEGSEYHLGTPIVALQYGEKQIGAIVDDADDVVFIAEDTMTDYEEKGIQAVARVNGRMIFILDIPYLLQSLKHGQSTS